MTLAKRIALGFLIVLLFTGCGPAATPEPGESADEIKTIARFELICQEDGEPTLQETLYTFNGGSTTGDRSYYFSVAISEKDGELTILEQVTRRPGECQFNSERYDRVWTRDNLTPEQFARLKELYQQ